VRLSVLEPPSGSTTIGYVATTVLIVDDHPSFRAAARRLLEAEGFDVVGEEPDGAAGLSAAGHLRPDVVLLDVHLPDSNGFDVAARITATGNGPAVILTSSRDASDFGPLVASSGARGFVAKGELSGAALAALLP
jgi:DNA-binding NarL/FixJ family response regulator